jgi:hypothetical protein
MGSMSRDSGIIESFVRVVNYSWPSVLVAIVRQPLPSLGDGDRPCDALITSSDPNQPLFLMT